MTTLKAARLLIGARQFDVAGATSIALNKIGSAERGLNTLSESEEALIWRYLRNRAVQMGTPPSILKGIFGVGDGDDGQL
jgi:hypothetical protein